MCVYRFLWKSLHDCWYCCRCFGSVRGRLVLTSFRVLQVMTYLLAHRAMIVLRVVRTRLDVLKMAMTSSREVRAMMFWLAVQRSHQSVDTSLICIVLVRVRAMMWSLVLALHRTTLAVARAPVMVLSTTRWIVLSWSETLMAVALILRKMFWMRQPPMKTAGSY